MYVRSALNVKVNMSALDSYFHGNILDYHLGSQFQQLTIELSFFICLAHPKVLAVATSRGGVTGECENCGESKKSAAPTSASDAKSRGSWSYNVNVFAARTL